MNKFIEEAVSYLPTGFIEEALDIDNPIAMDIDELDKVLKADENTYVQAKPKSKGLKPVQDMLETKLGKPNIVNPYNPNARWEAGDIWLQIVLWKKAKGLIRVTSSKGFPGLDKLAKALAKEESVIDKEI